MKEYLDVEFKKEDVNDDGTFSGFGSTFGGRPDSHGDIIAQGAFSDTLNSGGRNGFGVAMLWQHNSDQVPGIWTSMAENKKGLKVEGQLALATQLGKEAHELMKMGAVKGLSIGFDIAEDGSEFDDKKKARILKKLNLWEISLVTFPANTRAQITNVKAFEQAKTPRELEALLRDSGLSKQAAQNIVKLCKPSLRDSAGWGKALKLIDKVKEQNKDVAIL